MANVLRGVVLMWLAVGMAAGQIVLSPAPGGGGGATNLNGLTDVTITSAADGDGLRHNGTAFVNTALFTAGTSDLLASAMSANWGTAGTSACATSGGIMYDNATTVGCNSEFVFNGTTFLLGPALASGTPVLGMRQNTSSFTAMQVESNGSVRSTLAISNTPVFTLRQSTGHTLALSGAGTYDTSANAHKFLVGGTSMMEVGGSTTALIQDQTATTGVTSVVVKGGAGQGSGTIFEVQDNSAQVQFSVAANGVVTTGNTNFRIDGARWQTTNSISNIPMEIEWGYDITGTGGDGLRLGGLAVTSGSRGRAHQLGDAVGVRLAEDFDPVAGTATYSSFVISSEINQTGGANGITRGLYVNPTLTAAADFRAIEVAAGVIKPAGYAQASLPTGVPNGSIVFCTDCVQGTASCTGSGNGTMAFYLNSSWQCF